MARQFVYDQKIFKELNSCETSILKSAKLFSEKIYPWEI